VAKQARKKAKPAGSKKARRTKSVSKAPAKSSSKALRQGRSGSQTELAQSSSVPSMKLVRFAGVSLGGGKTDRTAVAILDYFPEQKRVFLRTLRERVTSREDETGDDVLLEILNEEEAGLSLVAFDVPLQFPVSIRIDMKGDKSDEAQVVKWMENVHSKRSKEKRPNKMFTPYTERACEIFIAHELEEVFHPHHSLGSNAAPLTARAHYLKKRIDTPLIETYPKLSLWRIGQDLNMPKSYLRFHKHAVDSDEARHYILKTLIEKEIAFIYQQDMKAMVENNVAFEAFLSALTAFLKFRGQTEKPPQDFPKGESWIEFPVQKIRWF
jgi:hypothetical protein